MQFHNNKYISKSGKEYIDLLKNVFSLNNRNDVFSFKEDVIQQPILVLSEFICKLKAEPMIIDLNKTDNKTKK